jgi:cytochrome c biogenesis protein
LEDGSLMLAARSGAARRLGYLLVHGAIVLICLGGLIDGNPLLRWRLWSGSLQLEHRNLAPGRVPEQSRLASAGGAFRASVNLEPGREERSAYLSFGDGYLLQDLPFGLRLKRFHIEHYAGAASERPSDFASELEIIDGDKRVPVSLHVNHPYRYKGVTLYQSGFTDGGSQVEMEALPLAGTGNALLEGRLGSASSLLLAGAPFSVELDEYRANIVFAKESTQDAAGDRWLSSRSEQARLQDVGPSLSFRLRDSGGQASEWLLYQRAIKSGNDKYMVQGWRATAGQPMHYLRLPADKEGGIDAYLAWSRAMAQPGQRQAAAHALALQLRIGQDGIAPALEQTAASLLDAFAASGYPGVLALMQTSVPQAQREKAGPFYAQLLERSAALLPGAAKQSESFVHDALAAYSDALSEHWPAIFRLRRVQQVYASGLQLTRAPGASLVYLGSAMLALGVCCMAFVRERRLWLVNGASGWTLALSGNRDTPALAQEFEQHRRALQAIA